MLRFIPRSPLPFDQHAAVALKPYTGVAARLLYARGMKTAKDADAFLHPSLDQLHDPFLLDGMEKAVEILQNAKVERLPVVVYGDYDVDGICAASLLTLALRRYGIAADSYTPLREDGYGLHSEAVEALSARYAVLLTVDLGITNHEEVLFAKEKGMMVIVTDHHEPGLSPSPADAVMDPLLGRYPFRRLCGTGVAFKLAQALLGLESCVEYLDLAALATVADIVPLTGENRALVSLGLPLIMGRKRPGMRALLTVSGDPTAITADTLGFQLGPRLNAAGRLGDAGKGVRLMMTDDPAEAEEIAGELDRLNAQRKTTEAGLLRQAEAEAREHDFIAEPGLILSGDGWHAGVIGLVAGRLCQRYFCPVCVLSRQDGLLHGSLRSVPGVHIANCLKACDDLLLRYGGHELAAGVTLKEENMSAFAKRMQEQFRRADPSCFMPALPYDEEITLGEANRELYEALRAMAPFGCDNPPPVFLLRDAALEQRRAVGAEGAHLKLTLRQEKSVMDGIAFSMGRLASTLPDRVDAAFCLGENTFRGLTSLQAEVKALVPTRAGTEETLSLADGEKEALSLLDALEALAGKTPSDGECLQGMSAAEAKAAFGESWRGDLLVCRTRESARRAVALSGGEFSFGLPADPLGFPAVALCPSMAAVTGHWKRVWLMDGPVCEGEAAFWRERLPDCQVVPLERSASLQALAGSLLLDDEGYRRVYRLLRKTPCHSLDALAQGAEITRVQARAALSVLQDMGLLAWADTPFSCALLPPVKCSLEENRLLRALRALGLSPKQLKCSPQAS